jgi:formylglycine-generating enzyme required for sulfatase activity
MPSTFITWFQALQACANVGKRLPTNAEWHVAAAGTPDTGGADDGTTTCNTDDLVPGATRTGSRQDCVSDRGAFDMVGNLLEWVADWTQGDSVPFEPSGDEGTAGPDFGDDFMRGTNPATRQGAGENFPSAIARGGSFIANTAAGVFTLNAQFSPAIPSNLFGFRCVLPR